MCFYKKSSNDQIKRIKLLILKKALSCIRNFQYFTVKYCYDELKNYPSPFEITVYFKSAVIRIDKLKLTIFAVAFFDDFVIRKR